MPIRPHELNADDCRVYTSWLRKIVALWSLIIVGVVVVCTVLALHASVTPDQRIVGSQHSGMIP
jgi:hypothetical protein